MKFNFQRSLGIAIVFLLVLISSVGYAQTPGVRWEKFYNLNLGAEIFYDIKPGPNKGFILCGSATSLYDKYQALNKRANGSWLILEIDSLGAAKTAAFQGYPAFDNTASAFTSLVSHRDGGYVFSGYFKGTTSNDTADFFMMRRNSSGNYVWQKKYGGSNEDASFSMSETSNGGFILAGYTKSNDVNVIGNHGVNTADIWVVKTDALGNIIWKKCFGGTASDTAFAIVETPDKGFIVAGSSSSSDGDVTENAGLTDGWVIKMDSVGNLLWQKTYGGILDDGLRNIVINADGSYTAVGYTSSDGVASNPLRGKQDLWLIKISNNGSLIWSKTFGGSENDGGSSLLRTHDNGFIMAGYTESNNNDVSTNSGRLDAWTIKVSNDGYLIWERSAGATRDEFISSLLYLNESDVIAVGGKSSFLPGDSLDGYALRIGNTAHFIGTIISPNQFSEGLLRLTKSGEEYSSIPFGNTVRMSIDTGVYVGTFDTKNPNYTVSPQTFNLVLSKYSDTGRVAFIIEPIAGRRDIGVDLITLSAARPGFDVTYKLIFQNNGTDTISAGQILFKKDPRLDFISSSPTESTISADTLRWDYNDLKPSDIVSILVRMKLKIPPIVNINDTLLSAVIIIPVDDLTPADDTAYLKQVVTGSYDPNDKNENNAGTITQAYVNSGKYLNYLIRFQNTGTDTAFNVVIRDTLDNKLDWNTLEMVAASHSYLVNITDQNKIAWTFPDIHLPDSNINEPASHGYIAYRIKPNVGLSPGEVISNSASIYFDFNLPVVTNTVLTEVSGNQALPLTLLDFKGVYRNDITELYWSTTNEYNVQKFEVERSFSGNSYSVIGTKNALNANSGITDYTFTDDLRNTANQSLLYYRLKMIDIDGKSTYSNTILIRRDQQLLRQIQILPNPVASNTAQVMIPSASNTKAVIRVTDLSGHVLLQQSERLYPGANSVLIRDLSKLSNGTYLLQVLWEGNSDTKKFIIQ
jgi:uncharacterized repeat protein (TIGR01451 family)